MTPFSGEPGVWRVLERRNSLIDTVNYGKGLSFPPRFPSFPSGVLEYGFRSPVQSGFEG